MHLQGSPQEDRAAEQASFSRKVAAERAAQRAQARAGLGRAHEGRRELDCSLLQARSKLAALKQLGLDVSIPECCWRQGVCGGVGLAWKGCCCINRCVVVYSEAADSGGCSALSRPSLLCACPGLTPCCCAEAEGAAG